MSIASKTSQANLHARMLAQEVFANNLANLNTIGFKRDKVSFESVMKKATQNRRNESAAAVPILSTTPDLSQGELEPTGNKLDFALHGGGFFVLETPTAELLTRDGSFVLNEEGVLMNRQGYAVALEEGGAEFGNSADIGVTPRGELYVDGQHVATLKIVDLPDGESAERVGSNMFRASVRLEPAMKTRVVQGHLERSNVRPIEEMVDMLGSYRLFEASQKAMEARGESLARLLSDRVKIS
jgi:flagellar basal-body rod protein FlgG